MTRWPVPRASSTIKSLKFEQCSFEQCSFDSAAVVQVLESAKRLEEFEHSHGTHVWDADAVPEDPRSRPAQLSWPMMRKVLDEHRDSLRTLSIQELRAFAAASPNEGRNGRLGDLSMLKKLEDVSVDIEILVDLQAEEANIAKKLPNNLKRLRLELWPEAHVSDLYGTAIASIVAGVFPGADKELLVSCQCFTGIGLAKLYLASTIEALSCVGIECKINEPVNEKRSSYKRNWTVKELEEIEEIDRNGGYASSDSDTPSDGNDEDSFSDEDEYGNDDEANEVEEEVYGGQEDEEQ
jgi:hypothetical protein